MATTPSPLVGRPWPVTTLPDYNPSINSCMLCLMEKYTIQANPRFHLFAGNRLKLIIATKLIGFIQIYVSVHKFQIALWGFHTEIASSKKNNWSTVLPMLYKTWWPHIIWFFVPCFYENRRWREDLKTKRLPKTQPHIAGINSYFFKQIVLAKYLSNFEYVNSFHQILTALPHRQGRHGLCRGRHHRR